MLSFFAAFTKPYFSAISLTSGFDNPPTGKRTFESLS
jgi:hypothetical protein